MNRLQFLLTKLAEEASEVAQIALKTQQFGLQEVRPGQPLTNAERVKAELNDLLAIVDMLNAEFGLAYAPDLIAIRTKVTKVNRYCEYSRTLGAVKWAQEGTPC